MRVQGETKGALSAATRTDEYGNRTLRRDDIRPILGSVMDAEEFPVPGGLKHLKGQWFETDVLRWLNSAEAGDRGPQPERRRENYRDSAKTEVAE